MKPREQALQITLEVCLVVRPCQPIHTGRGVVLEFEERLLKQIETEVVEERSELLLLPFLCDFPNAVQRRDTLSRSCARHVFRCAAFPLAPALRSTDSAASRPALFTSFAATMAESDFPRP